MAKNSPETNSRKAQPSRQGNQGNHDDKNRLTNIEHLLRLLTQKVDYLEARLVSAEAASGVLSPDIVRTTLAATQRKKPGRKRTYSEHELLARRDALIRFFETNWPELRIGIKKARGPRSFVRPFRRAKKPRG